MHQEAVEFANLIKYEFQIRVGLREKFSAIFKTLQIPLCRAYYWRRARSARKHNEHVCIIGWNKGPEKKTVSTTHRRRVWFIVSQHLFNNFSSEIAKSHGSLYAWSETSGRRQSQLSITKSSKTFNKSAKTKRKRVGNETQTWSNGNMCLFTRFSPHFYWIIFLFSVSLHNLLIL